MNEITGEALLKQMIELEPSNLDENAQKLFYKIIEVIDERDSLLKENQELRIQINAMEEVANQYKERIDKLSILDNIIDTEGDEDNRHHALIRKTAFEEILSKYKEIIGIKDE